MLFVPGGWASNKSAALGEVGKERIRRFVERGRSYLGFCGGAGLALRHADGLSLVPMGRQIRSIRVPGFSGKIRLRHERSGHPMWDGIPDGTAFHAWWPGQFSVGGAGNVEVIARYDEPEDGSFVADLPIGPIVDWDRWERRYGTNLNPARIKGEPAIIEAEYGRGKVLLSYLHFETPGDGPGHRVLLNLFRHLLNGGPTGPTAAPSPGANSHETRSARSWIGEAIADRARDLEAIASDLITFGEERSLWYWRNSWMLQWRRGVRGIEYCTLHAMLKKLAELLPIVDDLREDTLEKMEETRELLVPFSERAKHLLAREREAMDRGPLSPLESDDEQIRRMRENLFSSSKRFGGAYKQIIDRIDVLLLPLLRASASSSS